MANWYARSAPAKSSRPHAERRDSDRRYRRLIGVPGFDGQLVGALGAGEVLTLLTEQSEADRRPWRRVGVAGVRNGLPKVECNIEP